MNDTSEIPNSNSLLISPLYPDTVYFSVEAILRNQTMVTGTVEGYHDKTTEMHELYFQRFMEKQDSFRVIHCIGHGVETVSEFGRETSEMKIFNDTIKFNELGIFEGEPGDPVDLIPLYPGHNVKQGEYWRPKAKIKIPMGTGIAEYAFVIDTVYNDENGSVLAKVKVDFKSDLQPSKDFESGTVKATGGGWFVWDCTINQRRETHLSATYIAKREKSEVKQIVNVDDKLKVYYGKKLF
jgi:hypothetical protein